MSSIEMIVPLQILTESDELIELSVTMSISGIESQLRWFKDGKPISMTDI